MLVPVPNLRDAARTGLGAGKLRRRRFRQVGAGPAEDAIGLPDIEPRIRYERIGTGRSNGRMISRSAHGA